MLVDPRRGPPAPVGDAEQEAGDHDRVRVHGPAERLGQDPRPHDFQRQRGQAGETDGQGRDPGSARVVDGRRRGRDARVDHVGAVAAGAPPHAQAERDQTDGETQRRGRHRRDPHAPSREQDESGQGDPGQSAEGVEGVELPAESAETPLVAHEPLEQERQRGPHEHRGQEQTGGGDAHPEEMVEPGRAVEDALVHVAIDPIEGVEQAREHERVHPDADLQRPIDPQGIGQAVGEMGGDGAAQRQSAHEHAQRDGRRVDVAAEEQRELPHPQDLIDQRGQPGAEEEAEHHLQVVAGAGHGTRARKRDGQAHGDLTSTRPAPPR